MTMFDKIRTLAFKAAILAFLENIEVHEVKLEDAPLKNTQALIRIRDRFLAHDNTPSRFKAMRNLFNIVIFHIWHDQDYRERFEEVVEMLFDEINAGRWQRPNRSVAPVDDRWVHDKTNSRLP
jgi:hypothetical protein